MKRAAEAGDAEALSRYVNYPSLRESLKASFSALMVSEMAESESPFGALGAALGAAFANQMIDAFITPESLAMLMRGVEPQVRDPGEDRGTESSSETEAKISMAYEGLNQFVMKVKVKEKGSPEESFKFIYKRSGIISWKLSALRLPAFIMGNKTLSLASSKSIKLDSPSKEAESGNEEKPLLVPTLTNKRFQESDWQSTILFDISWDTSHLQKPTRAVKGTLVIGDIFGEPMLRIRWTINQPLTLGEDYAERGTGFEYNRFTDSQRWVRTTDLKDMTFRFEVTDIIYQDGTQEAFE
jgi:hypothetical protein